MPINQAKNHKTLNMLTIQHLNHAKELNKNITNICERVKQGKPGQLFTKL